MGSAPSPDEIAARQAIADVIHLYCHAIDRRRWALLDRCFHADATYKFGAIDGGWRDFVAAARAVITPTRISHHQVGNILYRIDGDTATTETYFTAYHRVPAGAPADAPFPGDGQERDIVIAGRYVDRFVRRDGDWRIAHRTGLGDWRRDAPGNDAGLFDQPPDWRGAIDPGDPGMAAVADGPAMLR